MKVSDALIEAAQKLSEISETARLDAELLMAKALGVERGAMLLHRMEEEAPASFRSLFDRRLIGEPIAYIIGRRAFWTIELEVGPGALIPRPDSETLIEAAVDHFGQAGPDLILDLGTGPGTLLLAALDQWPSARGLGIDISQEALSLAEANAVKLGLADRASFKSGDWTGGLDQRFDLILCNPPYVEAGANLASDVVDWEPHTALFSGEEGLDDYRKLAPQLSSVLHEEGIACIEIGAGQADAVTALFKQEGLEIATRNDLSGRIRCMVVTI